MIPDLGNINESNEMTSLNNILFQEVPLKYLWSTFSELLWHNWEPGWVKGYIFAPPKTKSLNKLVLVMVAADSFSLSGFIDFFSHHIGHTALLQSNARWKWIFQHIIKILAAVCKIPVSPTETQESS